MIVNHWPASFRALYGGEWPREYVCFDLETTGFDLERDVITQIAHVLVRDGRVVDELELTLDWTDHPIVNDRWLRNRLAALAAGMAAAGRTCQTTYETLRGGMEPAKALGFYRELFAVLAERDVILAAHNGYSFDEKMLRANLVGFGICADFQLGDNALIDTEGIVKASQAPDHPRCQPKPDDTLRSYFHRVRHTRLTGVRSNLDDHCFHAYGLGTKYGVDRAALHGALADSRCVHHLMEEFRARIDPGAIAAVPAAGRPGPAAPALAGPPRRAPARRRGQRRI